MEQKEELKTLKELHFPMNYGEEEFIKKLKAEAVKWIKEMPFQYTSVKNAREVCIVIDWIKHFFNITDEELK